MHLQIMLIITFHAIFIHFSLETKSLLIYIRSQKSEEDVMVMVVMMGSLNVRFKQIENKWSYEKSIL